MCGSCCTLRNIMSATSSGSCDRREGGHAGQGCVMQAQIVPICMLAHSMHTRKHAAAVHHKHMDMPATRARAQPASMLAQTLQALPRRQPNIQAFPQAAMGVLSSGALLFEPRHTKPTNNVQAHHVYAPCLLQEDRGLSRGQRPKVQSLWLPSC